MIHSIDTIRSKYTQMLGLHTDPAKALAETAAHLCVAVEVIAGAIEELEEVLVQSN
jgi:hypothetical protein